MVQQFMTLQEKIKELSTQYKIVAEVNLDAWHEMTDYQTKNWFRKNLSEIYKTAYEPNERIVFTLSSGDRYSNVNTAAGAILTQLQKRINEVDISNFFIILLTNDTTIPVAYSQVKNVISTDPVPISIVVYEQSITEKIVAQSKKSDYNSTDPIKISLDTLNSREQFLLT